jgi:large subunit ribosomal protein L3
MEMQKAIIGKKIGMTQIFDEAGRVVPVTLIEAGPCTVMQKKTAEKDGYEAIQLGFENAKEKHLTKPEIGHQKKAGVEELKKVLKEFALKDCSQYNVGDVLTANVFAKGEFVDVTGISKGHGYQGVVKRHGAGRTPMTHGGGPVHRHAGSMGVIDPARIMKGKIGAGQMGNEQVTVQNLDIVLVDEELGLIAVRGAIPGPKGGVVFVKNTVKVHKVKQAGAGISNNPQKASARVNPQKASARNK